MILNSSESLAKPLVMAKLNMAYLSSLKKPAKLLSSSLLVSPSLVLCAPGTSLYHLVLKHLRATWPRPEQSHFLPEACSPNGTDNRRQRQRWTKHPPPEPSDILKRFHALYDNKWRYCMKKVSKLNYLLNPLTHGTLDFGWSLKLQKKSCRSGLTKKILCFFEFSTPCRNTVIDLWS